MPNKLKQLIELAKRTGDRLIVADFNNLDDSYVILGINDYERLVSGQFLTEEDLVDKINRDIAIWKTDEEIDEDEEIEDFNDDQKDFGFLEKPADDSLANPINETDADEDEEEIKRGWTIPSQRKQRAEEADEDQQYLEEITF